MSSQTNPKNGEKQTFIKLNDLKSKIKETTKKLATRTGVSIIAMSVLLGSIAVSTIITFRQCDIDNYLFENYNISFLEYCYQTNSSNIKLPITGVKGAYKTVEVRPAIQGERGLQGNIGLTGQIGLQGQKGQNGVNGESGPQGNIGPIGLQGLVGANGLIGQQGVQGIQGLTGATGLTGAQGSQGVAGSAGLTGAQGLQGLIGLAGQNGTNGNNGATGPQGLQGLQGILGADGLNGKTVLNGTVIPTLTDGVEGDFFINSLTGVMYGPKTSTGWGAGLSLIGQTGLNGTNGNNGVAGSQGIQGLTGLPGATGQQGITGATGPQGIQGLTGAQGIIGQTGLTGPQGQQGSTGNTGAQGLVGATGQQGIQGLTGATGIQGLTGYTGAQGTQGIQGQTGAIGANGSQGIQGLTGFTGQQGIQGSAGATGNTGAQGVIGLTGDAGATGSQGIQGLIGLAGAQGAQGQPGTNGLNGKSLLNGTTNPDQTTGAEGDFYINTSTNEIYGPKTSTGWGTAISLIGAQGIQGQAGTNGLQGIQGLTGLIGQNGAKGNDGAVGAQGIQGLTGNTGAQGIQGLQGLTGDTGPEGLQGIHGIQGMIGLAGQNGINGNDGAVGATGTQGLQGASGIVTANAPLTYDALTQSLSILQANTTQGGYLSAADWNIFNNKQGALNVSNGLTLAGAELKLGGNLLQNTTIDGTTANYGLTFINGNLNLGYQETPLSSSLRFGEVDLYVTKGYVETGNGDIDKFGIFFGNKSGPRTNPAAPRYSNSNIDEIGIGSYSLSNSSGFGNIAIGSNSLSAITDFISNLNTSIGYSSGVNLISGSNNLALGNSTDFASSTGSNQLNIANGIFGIGLNGSVLNPKGLIGIGEIAPTDKLTVNSGVVDDSGLTLNRLSNTTPASTATNYLGFDNTGKVVKVASPSGGLTSLQNAYNFGGAGLGRFINIDNDSPVEIRMQSVSSGQTRSAFNIVGDGSSGNDTQNGISIQRQNNSTYNDILQFGNIDSTNNSSGHAQLNYNESLQNLGINSGSLTLKSISWSTIINSALGTQIFDNTGAGSGLLFPNMNDASQATTATNYLGFDNTGRVVKVASPTSGSTYTAGTGLSLTGTTFANTGLTSLNGSTGNLTLSATNSILGNGTTAPFSLVGDSAAPGNSQYYGTNASGAKGYYALPSGACIPNGTGSFNSCVSGDRSFISNTTGFFNTANGFETLFANTIGNRNTANGFYALRNNTTGRENTATGYGALVGNSTATGNSAFGDSSLYYVSSGNYNTAVGSYSLNNMTIGSNNVSFGYNSGYNLTSGSNNTALGSSTDLASSTGSNQLNIANNIFGTGLDGSVGSPSGLIGIGEVAPTDKLTVNSGFTNNSGLTLKKLSNATPASTATNYLGFDNAGKVVKVATPGSTSLQAAYDYTGNGAGNNINLFQSANPITINSSIQGKSSLLQFNNNGNSEYLSISRIPSNSLYTGFSIDTGKRFEINAEVLELNSALTYIRSSRTQMDSQTFSISAATNGSISALTSLDLNTPKLKLNQNPGTNNAINQILVRDSTDGTIKLRDASSIGGGGFYTAGTGLSLTGTTFANTGVTSLNGSTGALTLSAANSITGNGTSSPFSLVGDSATPGNSQYYGTNGTGAKGYYDLKCTTTGPGFSNSCVVGNRSLQSNIFGSYNTAHGEQSLFSNTSGNSNTANGSTALSQNTSGSFNSAFGATSLKLNTTGIGNTATGESTLNYNTIGNYNVANGFRALLLNNVGINNTSIGSLSGSNNTSGNNNTSLGANTYFATATGSNQLNIANNIFGTDLNGYTNDGISTAPTAPAGLIGIGNPAPTNKLTVDDLTTTSVAKFNGSGSTQCTVVTGTGWSCSSDARLKTNIVTGGGLDQINRLRGVQYNWLAGGEIQNGFIAQEVESVIPNAVSTDSNGYLSLNQNAILPVAVNAIQDLNKLIIANKLDIDTKFTALETRVNSLSQGSSSVSSSSNSNNSGAGSLVNGNTGVASTNYTTTANTFTQPNVFQQVVNFVNNIVVNGLATIQDLIVRGSAVFQGRVEFQDRDMAGVATIKQSATEIAINYTTPYNFTPVVNITGLGNKIPASLKSSNSRGFVIEIETTALVDLRYNWVAINARGEELQSGTASSSSVISSVVASSSVASSSSNSSTSSSSSSQSIVTPAIVPVTNISSSTS